MDQKEFTSIVQDVIQPLFTGSELIETPEVSSKAHAQVAFGENNYTLLLKPTKDDDYRFKLTRQQQFTNDDISIVKAILNELNALGDIPVQYRDELLVVLVEKAISQSLVETEQQHKTLLSLLQRMHTWAGRTYEGRDVAFGIELDLNRQDGSDFQLNKYVGDDCFALLSDGIDSKIKIDSSGKLIAIEQCPPCMEDLPKVPFRFMRFANSLSPQGIGIILLENKEILIIKEKELAYAYRRGFWRRFNHDAIIKRIAAGSKYPEEDVRIAIYSSCLDVSFARTGGSITCLRKTREKRCQQERIAADELIATGDSVKAITARIVAADRTFDYIERKIRQELIGIDGATILRSDGSLLACGAIVKIRSGSVGGGRLASVLTLAEYGVAIKISSDGEITGYYVEIPSQEEEESQTTSTQKDAQQDSGSQYTINELFRFA